MKRKVAKGLLAAMLILTNIPCITNMVYAMSDTTEQNTVNIEKNVTVEGENNSTTIAGEVEEQKPVELDDINTIEDKSTGLTGQFNNLDRGEASAQACQKTEEINTTSILPQIKSSDSINPTTEVYVSNEAEFELALSSGDKKIILQKDITLSKPLIINQDNIVIDGNDNKLILNDSDQRETENRFVIKKQNYNNATKVKNVVLKNMTFEGYYLNAISLYWAENVRIENVTLLGQDVSNPSESRSNVGIDLDYSTATISNIKSMNHRYAGIRVRNESNLTFDGWNEHTNDTNDLDSQVKVGANDNKLNNVGQNYTEWQIKPGSDSSPVSTIYKAKTKMEVKDLNEFKKAIEIPNTVIELRNDLEINESVEIKSKHISVEGHNHLIKVISNAAENQPNTAGLAVKAENTALNNIKIKNETTKPGITLYGAKNARLSDITIEGIEPAGQDKKELSGVALDIYKTTVELANIKCSNSVYRDFQVRGGSTVTLSTKNIHSSEAVHIQTIQKKDEDENIIIDQSNYYMAGREYEENNEKKVDFFLKNEVFVSTLDELVSNIQNSGTIITLKNDIKVNTSCEIEVGRNVTIDGAGNTLDLNDKAKLILKGKDIVVKNLDVNNSDKDGICIYNSKNVLLEKVNVRNSSNHGLFVNGSTVVLRNFTTSSNGAEGIKITRYRTLNSSSHNDSEVMVEESCSQTESTISVSVVDLEMVDGYEQNNTFIPLEGTYSIHENDAEYKKLSQETIDVLKQQGMDFDEDKSYWEKTTDYLVMQGKLDVTSQITLRDEKGIPIQLDNKGVVDNTDNLIKLIEYAASHSQELYFPPGIYKITDDIDLSNLNLPAVSNFKLTGDPNGLSIIDGSNSLTKMLKIMNEDYHTKMNYVDIEHLVFNNVGIAINGPYKKGITLKNNVFMNGNYTRELREDGSVYKATMEPYILVRNNKFLIEKNIFLRGANYPGRGIVTYRSNNTSIIDNYFGSLDGIDEGKQMIPELTNKLSSVKASGLTDGNQGNFFTAINNERYDKNVLIQNNYFNLLKTRNVLSDFEDNTLISGINVATDGQRRDHIIYSKGYDNLQIVGNYFKGQENGAAGGVKIRNGKNAYIGANYFDDVPLLTYIYPDLTKAETLLYNTVIYNNLFHQKTNFGQQGTGILFYQSFRDGDNLTFSDGDAWNHAYGDVQNFIIYKNMFKSDERDRITISGRAQKAYEDNQFLAHGNMYENKNTLVNYDTAGNLQLAESTLVLIEDRLKKLNTDYGYTSFVDYQKVRIPLTPAKVDYTYLEEIYDKTDTFLNDLDKNSLVGNTPGKYPKELVTQLQEMMAEIDKLYKEGKLLQGETNIFITKLNELYEVVSNSKIAGDTENDLSAGGESGADHESGNESKPEVENDSHNGNNSGTDHESDKVNHAGTTNNSGNSDKEPTSGSVNKPTINEEETLDKLPQTGGSILRVITALGIVFIIIAVFLMMKRSRTEREDNQPLNR